MKAHGNIVDHEYEIERDGDTVATVSKKWFRVRDSYGVDVAAGEDAAAHARDHGRHRLAHHARLTRHTGWLPTPECAGTPPCRALGSRGRLRGMSAPAVITRVPWPVAAPVPREWVPRPRLVRSLQDPGPPLVVLVAPAGYGKTALLGEWAERDRRPVRVGRRRRARQRRRAACRGRRRPRARDGAVRARPAPSSSSSTTCTGCTRPPRSPR